MDRSERHAAVRDIAALDQPLRGELYALLVDDGGWFGRDAAADATGVARSVAAFHLDKLAEAGLVDVRFERPPGRSGPGAGRPAKQYRRSRREVSVSLPDRRYDLAGALLADAVDETASSGRPVDVTLAEAAHRAGSELGETARDERGPSRSIAATRDALVTALRDLGYEPKADGRDVALANCPFHTLAERHRPLICGMNLDLLSGFAAAFAGERITARLQPDDEMCCVRLQVG